MKVAGIVCEYNPFHNGHARQIEKTREAGATHIVCAMSGNFVQRGEAAFIDKWKRAEISINCGADLVIDLPVPWSCDSAENFAFGAVSMLDAMNINMLSFGSETTDVRLLIECANSIDDYQVGKLIKSKMSVGLTYPGAFCKSVEELYGSEVAEVLSLPNSTLAIEYIRALKKVKSKAEICAVERNAAHDSFISEGNFISAAALRNMTDFSMAKQYMPKYAFEKVFESIAKGENTMCGEKIQQMILFALRSISLEQMQAMVSNNSGIAQRIYNAVKTSCSLDDLFETAKTKSITMAKLRRTVTRLFLGISDDVSQKAPPYIKVLAANKKGFEIMANAKGNIPVVTKHSEILKLDEFSKQVYDIQCRSTDLYMLMQKKIRACSLEQTSPVIIIK